jgi:hypothetical protein
MEEFYLLEKLSRDIGLTDRDETFFQKYKRLLMERITKFYIDHIPIDYIQEMSPVCKFSNFKPVQYFIAVEIFHT